MQPATLQITDPNPTCLLAKVAGGLGPESCDSFEKFVDLVSGHNPKLVILDISGLTYIGSRSLGDLVRLRATLAKRQGKVRLASPQPAIAQLIELSRLDAALPCFQSVAEAKDYRGATL